jgi:hypothetical protein
MTKREKTSKWSSGPSFYVTNLASCKSSEFSLGQTDSCINCKWSLVREKHPPEKGQRYNYEACSLGVIPMVRWIPTSWKCHLWQESSSEGESSSSQPQ